MKVIVFDFDETLGHFGQLGDFIEAMERWFNKPIKREVLYKLLDIYPFYLRTKIFAIMNRIKKLKKSGKINRVIIYTNNMAPRAWVLGVKTYFELKMNYKLFDRVISAYKVGGKQIEKKRTSHGKTYKDLLNTANLSGKTKVLFFDDQAHPIQQHENVDYIHVIPYTYIMGTDEMLGRFFHNKLLGNLIRDKKGFINFMRKELNHYNGRGEGKLVHKIPSIEGNEIIKIINSFADY